MESAIHPNEGQIVVTADGHELGKVKEVSATKFKVDAAFGRDYWLANDTVEVEEGGTLRLILTGAGVDAAKSRDPD